MHSLEGLKIILDFVSDKTLVHQDEIKSKCRQGDMATARHIYCWFARTYTYYTLDQIGAYINRNHASILHGIKKIDNRIEMEPKFRDFMYDTRDKFTRSVYPRLKKIQVFNPIKNTSLSKHDNAQAIKAFYEQRLIQMYNIAAKEFVHTIKHIEEDAVMEGFRKADMIGRYKKAKQDILEVKMMTL